MPTRHWHKLHHLDYIMHYIHSRTDKKHRPSLRKPERLVAAFDAGADARSLAIQSLTHLVDLAIENIRHLENANPPRAKTRQTSLDDVLP